MTTTYRSRPCTFCDETGRETCRRCAAWVCASHEMGDRPHCALCAKELYDDLDQARFVAALKQPGENRGLFAPATVRPRGEHFSATLSRWFNTWRAKRAFARRSAAEIAAWRERAGIRVRGD